VTSSSGDGAATSERELVDRFRAYYLATDNEAFRELERRTYGAAYGGNGYTDIHQVERLVSLLGLSEGDRVLELGSGAGWPGLYIARESGSSVVLSDVPWEGVSWGLRRGRAEGLPVDAIACPGAEIPFRDGSFDGVTHSDVLC
jgi:SAM-dependent methyltransferase